MSSQINLDENPRNANWLHGEWNLPAYRTPEFHQYLSDKGITLTEFKKGPLYRMAVKRGLIVNDKWNQKKKRR